MKYFLAKTVLSSGDLDRQVDKNFLAGMVQNLFIWLGALAFVMIIVGGVKYITASGDMEKLKKAQKTIALSVTGLIVAALATVLIRIVTGLL